jgi:hypothetical protein
VRQDRRLQLLDAAGQHTEPSRLDAVLDARLEQHLHADADAQQRPARFERGLDRRRTVHSGQSGDAGGERADARDDEAIRLDAPASDRHAGADALEGPLD